MIILSAAVLGGGTGLIHSIFVVGVLVVCALIIWWLVRKALTAFAAPPIAIKCWDGFILVCGAVVVLNFLLGLIDHQFIAW